MTVLSEEEIRNGLAGLPGWKSRGEAITKQFRFDGFRAAVAFVVRAAFEAEAVNHHPDLDIRYSEVGVTLSTHSEGGVTAKDVELAKAIDSLSR